MKIYKKIFKLTLVLFGLLMVIVYVGMATSFGLDFTKWQPAVIATFLALTIQIAIMSLAIVSFFEIK